MLQRHGAAVVAVQQRPRSGPHVARLRGSKGATRRMIYTSLQGISCWGSCRSKFYDLPSQQNRRDWLQANALACSTHQSWLVVLPQQLCKLRGGQNINQRVVHVA